MERLISFIGLLSMMFIAWILSENRRRMNFRLILSGVALQLVLALFLLWTPYGTQFFHLSDFFIGGLLACSNEGAKFVFGNDLVESTFAFTVLPTVIFFSALTAVLFYLGVLQLIVKGMARVMVWVMDASGSESLATAANVFVGMTVAPFAVRPYLETMTRSEIMALMTGGMATVASGVMAAYVAMGAEAGHLMLASIMSAPAALVIAKIMVPETETSVTKGHVTIDVPKNGDNLLDAACRGAAEGLKLALTIGAMLIAFLALIHMIDWGLAWTKVGGEPLTLARLLGWGFAPLAWLMGVEWQDAQKVGTLLGQKTVLNEFIAYQSLMTSVKSEISHRSYVISLYALCGFANFGSIGVMIGGLGNIVPKRRADLAKYGLRSMIGGSLAAFMTACIVGMLYMPPDDSAGPRQEETRPAATQSDSDGENTRQQDHSQGNAPAPEQERDVK